MLNHAFEEEPVEVDAARILERVELLVNLADIAYRGLGQVDRALVALRYAYDIDPTRPDVLERARIILTAEAREFYERALGIRERAGLSAAPYELAVNLEYSDDGRQLAEGKVSMADLGNRSEFVS